MEKSLLNGTPARDSSKETEYVYSITIESLTDIFPTILRNLQGYKLLLECNKLLSQSSSLQCHTEETCMSIRNTIFDLFLQDASSTR